MTEVGATLREARMRAKIDIIDVEVATKIRAKYLRALENEEWGSLPGPTYVKSFLRTYADYLGLDGRLLIDEYKRRNESPSEAELPPIRPGRERERGGRRGPSVSPRAVVIGLIVLAFLGALYGLGAWKGSSGSSAPSAATAPTGARAHHRSHRRGAASGAPQRARTVRLQLVPTGAVYVCLADGAGRTLIPGRTLTPGQPSPVFTRSRFLVRLGNSSVMLKVNGRTLAVPARPAAVNYVITPAGHRPTARSPRCA